MQRRTFLKAGLCGAILSAATLRAARADNSLSDEEVVGVVFDEIERIVIEEYFGGQSQGKGKKNKDLPPGLAKRDQLPPGLSRQIQRNGTLPPGLQTYDLPPDLIGRLPPAPGGTRRVIVGNDVVLIRQGTRYILDVIKDVLTQ